MRALLVACVFGVAGAALLPAAPAKAWWDGYHHWHPGFYRPHVVVAPPPVYYAPRPPYAHFVPAHYNRWGRFIPGHWV